MIIAFDGNVFSGKTSLTEGLSLLGVGKVIKEHSEFLERECFSTHKPTDQEYAIFMQKKYFSAEEKRCLTVLPNEILLLDRSIISLAAHVYVLNKVQHIDIRSWFLEELNKRFDEGRILIPDLFCYVKCSNTVIHKRVVKDNARNTDPVYFASEYLDTIDYFNMAWFDKVGGIIFDTEACLVIELAQKLKQQILMDRQRIQSQTILSYLYDIIMR